jgi:hypothetical protein
MQNDIINKPKHYNFGEIEPLDAIEDWDLPYHLGNTVKYIARHQHKGKPLEDLKKAQYYLNRYIEKYNKLKGMSKVEEMIDMSQCIYE